MKEIEEETGRSVNSSITGQAGGFGQPNYATSIVGIIGLIKSLALETAKNGITVNSVCPGFIETEMVEEMPESVREDIISKIPMKRLGQTKEIAERYYSLLKQAILQVNRLT